MTTTPEQNRLRQLEAKIKGLPVQEVLLRRRELFRGAQREARQRWADLQVTLEQVKALRTIQAKPDLLAQSEQKRLSVVWARARELLGLVGEANPESDKFSEKLDTIKRTTRALSDDVKTTWGQVCQDHQDRANVWRPLAKQLSPKLFQCIQDLDRLLSPGTTSSPTSADMVRAIVDARRALASELASLAIDGPIEKFLRDAQAGNGDPKGLLDPRVLEYLDAHPVLWRSLRVVMI
ncbi:MAG TPA: hypothetical protein PLN31_14575 [Azoarcus taiwanensis]|nr:hypothetical protein [Azoarcus taiwanensis]